MILGTHKTPTAFQLRAVSLICLKQELQVMNDQTFNHSCVRGMRILHLSWNKIMRKYKQRCPYLRIWYISKPEINTKIRTSVMENHVVSFTMHLSPLVLLFEVRELFFVEGGFFELRAKQKLLRGIFWNWGVDFLWGWFLNWGGEVSFVDRGSFELYKGGELPFVDRGSFELRGVELFFCWQGDLVNWGREFFKKHYMPTIMVAPLASSKTWGNSEAAGAAVSSCNHQSPVI